MRCLLGLNLSSRGLEFLARRDDGTTPLSGLIQLGQGDRPSASGLAERTVSSLGDLVVSAVAASGGFDGCTEGGVLPLSDPDRDMLVSSGPMGLAPLVALELSRMLGVEALLVEPFTAREGVRGLTGLPELPIRPLRHAPQVKWCYLRAREEGLYPPEASAVVAYLGRGTSVCALKGGRVVDSNNPEETGPFSVAFAGSLPAMELVRRAMSGALRREDLTRLVAGGGGVVGYLGTYNLVEVEALYHRGDQKARLVVEAMAHQLAQEMGSMAQSLGGRVDFMALCGGGAAFAALAERVSQRVQWIAPVLRYPEVDALESVVQLALRHLATRGQPG